MTYFNSLLFSPQRTQTRMTAGISSEHLLGLLGRPIELVRSFIVRERTRRQLLELDARLLRDIGLKPYEVFRGWTVSRQAEW